MQWSSLQIMAKNKDLQTTEDGRLLPYEEDAKEILENALIRYPFRQRSKIIKALQKTYPDLSTTTAYKWIDDIKQGWHKKVTDYDITTQVSQFQKIIEKAEEELWKIILDRPRNREETEEIEGVVTAAKGKSEYVVISALKQIVDNRKKLFDVMMDSGFITRHLGTGEIKHAFLGGLYVQTDDGVKIREQVDDMKKYIETRFEEVGIDLNQSSMVYAEDAKIDEDEDIEN